MSTTLARIVNRTYLTSTGHCPYNLRMDEERYIKRAQDARIEIRCHSEQKAELLRAAEGEARPLSNWLLYLGLREVKKMQRGEVE